MRSVHVNNTNGVNLSLDQSDDYILSYNQGDGTSFDLGTLRIHWRFSVVGIDLNS